MRSDGADRITEVADRLFAAIEGGDVAAVARMWADDIAVWQSGDPHDRDKERALRVIDWFISGTVERRYEVLDRQVFDDGFVQQHILLARGRTGASIALRVCLVVRIGADGLINRIDEYFDPAGIAPLLAAQDG
ncbi:nuclear transport factor 2 family protein [Mycolicibacterium thermoresistibile]|jgi:ketosteroid isomerase-like protein|nr:nuclear transport factor 2 family protein [Mycolicibacterium thermoresistibile]MCV7188661.1 nuclear transport factor 2 family protein [Mycolicibacterium thermoresistibile]SNW17547.1 ketosteroid isomerase-like protein [Mycolicibacterium thermoresistibile]